MQWKQANVGQENNEEKKNVLYIAIMALCGATAAVSVQQISV